MKIERMKEREIEGLYNCNKFVAFYDENGAICIYKKKKKWFKFESLVIEKSFSDCELTYLNLEVQGYYEIRKR